MKILVYGLNYAPELTGIGKYTAEMASWLVAAGHDVRVIAAPPYYPAWKVREDYSAYRYRIELIDGVEIWRAPLWVPSKGGGLKRIIHQLSFAASSFFCLAAQWRWSPQVVWLVAPPLCCAPSTLLFAKLKGVPSWLHIQDYEVDAAFNLGLLKGAVSRKFVTRVERWLLQRFDVVSTISVKMMQLAKSKHVSQERVIFFPNWVDVRGISPLDAVSVYRERLGLPADCIVALYSGNMGNKQGLEILSDLANKLSSCKNIFFVYCGNGSGRADLEERCVGLANVIFMDLQPRENLNQLLGLADIHLLPQRADAADLVMPSKLTGMAASGRAVVVTAHSDSELGKVVAEFGLVVAPENVDALADAVLKLSKFDFLRDTFAKKARLYAENVLSREGILTKFESDLKSVVKTHDGKL